MATATTKLPSFRQLSLDEHRRKNVLKKQFSEDRPPQVRVAWESNPSTPKGGDGGIVVKKCVREAKRGAMPPKLSRHGSLEKDSILYSKQELAERLRQALEERERSKPNLNIFLARNTSEEEIEEVEATPKPTPKLMPPLLDPSIFQVRKTTPPPRSTAVVVIPIVEREESPPPPPKAVKDVIIRPSTAAAKRERFHHHKAASLPSRPPLLRSSSAPARPPEPPKAKFLATKRRIKSGRRGAEEEVRGEGGGEIVTMVSLTSPANSDNEEAEVPERGKVKEKAAAVKKEEKEVGKNVSLRKTVKSVTFQQSSIHAIRSFSASFPARRGSMATAIMLAGTKAQKNQEKRATNSTTPDDDERGPKRRLVRSATDKTRSTEDDNGPEIASQHDETEAQISVDIKAKAEEDSCTPEVTSTSNEESAAVVEKSGETENLQFGSVKEKECWNMYCKMADKGLKVSYDTILRGMLTPTEYRMRRKESIVNVPGDAQN